MSLVLAAGLMVAPATPLLQNVAAARAATVVAGDIVFVSRNPYALKLRHTDGSVTNLVTLASDDTRTNAAVSPDGSKVVFDSRLSGREHAELYVINSDGSGLQELTTSISSNPSTDWFPSWCGGHELAFERLYNNGPAQVWKLDLTTGSSSKISTDDTKAYYSPVCSSDGSKVAFAHYDSSRWHSQVYYMDQDGSNETWVPNQPASQDNDEPAWDNTNRLYFQGMASGYSSIDGINLDGSHALQVRSFGTQTPAALSVSPDNSKVVFSLPDGHIYQVATNASGSLTNLTQGWTSFSENPTFVKATYPPAPPANATAAIGGPSPHDVYGQRQLTIKLPTAGVAKFQYGWSNSITAPPNTAYLQESTTTAATLSFLGKYSGSGTTWDGGVQPDQDWYLWVRAYKTSGGAQPWATPLKVRVPKAGIAAVAGDSYSSGHGEASDQPQCPTQSDAAVRYTGKTIGCTGGGGYLPANDPLPNNPAASWAATAIASYNNLLHLPAAWQLSMGPIGADGLPVGFIARSGAPTSQFGRSDLAIPGTAAWASADTQSAKVSALLYDRYDSWNLVTMTGGADDTNWTDALGNWYFNNWNTPSLKPWAVTGGIANCPDANSVYNDLTVSGYVVPSTTVNALIQTNLQGMVTLATAESPGVRVLNLGYPYTVNSTGNSCYADSGATKGVKSVIDQLNSDHTFVSGANTKYVNLVTALGTNPMSGNPSPIQPNRLYGYPHLTIGSGSGTGQSKVAAAAIAVLTGSGW